MNNWKKRIMRIKQNDEFYNQILEILFLVYGHYRGIINFIYVLYKIHVMDWKILLEEFYFYKKFLQKNKNKSKTLLFNQN